MENDRCAPALDANEKTGRAKLEDFLGELRVAYFSMEVALENDVPTYSGGLGVLAGDTLRSAADLDVPLVAVTLVSHAGYVEQDLDEAGHQLDLADPWDPNHYATLLPATVAVPIEGRAVWIRAWLYVVRGHMGGAQPVILLDTDVDQNRTEDRALTSLLYGGDSTYRLKQEIVLGVGGVRILRALGFRIRRYHMNEGHAALLGLELLRSYAYAAEDLRPGEARYDLPEVRKRCVFTTHTPVDAGHDQFPYDLVQRVLGDIPELPVLRSLAGEERLNMTRLALNLSEYVNGVAKRHAEVSRKRYPGYRVHAVTNGVHPFTWTCSEVGALFNRYVPGWCHEPELLVRADQIPDGELFGAHVAAKRKLFQIVHERRDASLDPDVFTVGFARRMTAYKRPELLFRDTDRLVVIARHRPIQIVIAGRAHPQDESGKHAIEAIHAAIRALEGRVSVVFVPDYDMTVGLAMVSGSDIWLNTPLPPLEASGTSGMKAAFNGVPSLSVLDGWWVEGCIEGVTGWAIGELPSADETVPPARDERDAQALYQKLGDQILPLYYDDRTGWLRVMKNCICKNASFFNSHRMLRRYVTEAYLP